MAPKIMKPFLAEVLAKTKNDEHFVKGTLGTLKSIYLNLVEITWCKGLNNPISSLKEI